MEKCTAYTSTLLIVLVVIVVVCFGSVPVAWAQSSAGLVFFQCHYISLQSCVGSRGIL